MQSSKEYPKIIVQPLNGKRETLGVLLAVSVICLLVALRLEFLPQKAPTKPIKSYQALDSSLEENQRVLYQALLAAQEEITFLRQNNLAWPSAQELSEEAIPPFANDLMPGNLADYSWKTYDRGAWVDYLGRSHKGSGQKPTVIFRVIDLHTDFHPHPHVGDDYGNDQKITSQVWFEHSNNDRYPGLQLTGKGWKWIVTSL